MFLTYATAQGRVLLDREPYLPQVWAYDGQRQREAGVPEEVAFRTEPSGPGDAGASGGTGSPHQLGHWGWSVRQWPQLERAGIPHLLAIRGGR